MKHFHELINIPFGVKRRALILEILNQPNYIDYGLSVNIKHCAQLSEDSDLRYLLAKGILSRTRENAGGNKKVTRLILAKERRHASTNNTNWKPWINSRRST